ncbi:LysR family transcriptional regulator [Granulosicoccus antarcticus]|uniref:PCP degradation transcriptional activation protein n=1 Tax=Granulosicoccus antarcticus IMCC3135 TaxID=1192854 RepID=A0A2Z2NPG1_9GAMM|nr:LysR family transcriptional regulator [Granulosicoccus antarcticus]ASJ73149.1 PCP degradation transcriptional activation protein [Granulosicoccus antarcticus IMCC3135]
MEKTDYLDIDGRQLRLLLTIHEFGSLTQTAQHLDMNQSTVSYWLDQLRRKFDDQLFTRSGAGVVATARAEQLMPQARELLNALSTFVEPDAYDPSQDRGILRIAGNALERDLFIAPLVQVARKLAPTLSFQIVKTGSAYQVIEDLQQGRIDLAFFHTNVRAADGIRQKVLLRTKFVVFHDPATGTAPTDLDGFCRCEHALVSLGPDSHSDIDEKLASLGKRRRVIFKAADFDTLAILVRDTAIVVTLPEVFRYSSFKDFAYVPLPWEPPTVSWAVLWHARQHEAARSRFWRQRVAEIDLDSGLSGKQIAKK